jgi:hypothetical protein
LPARGLDGLPVDRDSFRLKLKDKDRAAAVEPALATESDREIPRSLGITFIHDEPDLHQTIPAVPG